MKKTLVSSFVLVALLLSFQNVMAQSQTTSVQDVPIVSAKTITTTKTTPVPVATTPTPVETTPTIEVAPTVVAKASTESGNSSSGFSKKGTKTFGLTVGGFYDINSRYESLYVNFPTQNINAAGLGFNGYFEFGISDRFAGEISLGYSRLLYSNKFKNIIKENFFVADAVAHCYLSQNEKIQPYLIAGVGSVISSSSVAPTLDLGVGSYFKLADQFSLKAEVIVKSAIIYNRAEGRFGFAYHF